MSEQQRKEFEDERSEYLSAEWWILVMFIVAAALPWLVATLAPYWPIVGSACIGVAILGLIVYAALQRPT